MAISWYFFLFSVAPSFSLIAAQTSPQPLSALDSFSALDPCAQNCFTHSLAGCTWDYLGASLQCTPEPNVCSTNFGVADSCYCRTDKQNAALSILSSCVKSGCTIGNP